MRKRSWSAASAAVCVGLAMSGSARPAAGAATMPDALWGVVLEKAPDVKLTADSLTGEVVATVQSGAASVVGGFYGSVLDGWVIDETMAGRFKAELDEGKLSADTFTGTTAATARGPVAAPK